MNSFIEKKFGKFYHPIVWNCKRFWKYKIISPFFYKQKVKNTSVEPNKVVIYTRDYEKMSPSFEKINFLLKVKNYNVIIKNKLKSNNDEIEFIKEIVSAKFIIINQDCTIINILPIREETKVINLWHGCGALKKFGCSKMQSWNNMFYPYKRFNNYSLFTVSSDKVLPYYEEATKIKFERNILKAVGISRTDIFFEPVFLELCNRKKITLTNKKIILYAPTMRGTDLSSAYTPEFINFELLKEKLSNEYIFLVKRHPDTLDKPYSIPKSCKDFVFDVSEDGSISELIVMSDILVSDYSSLFFEWCLFDKPVLFLTPDFEDYFDNRGFYIDFKSIVDKARCNTTPELVSAIQNIDAYDFSFVKQVRDDYMSACDGHSTERIVELMEKL